MAHSKARVGERGHTPASCPASKTGMLHRECLVEGLTDTVVHMMEMDREESMFDVGC